MNIDPKPTQKMQIRSGLRAHRGISDNFDVRTLINHKRFCFQIQITASTLNFVVLNPLAVKDTEAHECFQAKSPMGNPFEKILYISVHSCITDAFLQ